MNVNMAENKKEIENLITKMQVKWETNDKFRLPDVVYESFNQGSLSKQKDVLKLIDEMINKYELVDRGFKKENIVILMNFPHIAY
jgi:hypothetical protein